MRQVCIIGFNNDGTFTSENIINRAAQKLTNGSSLFRTPCVSAARLNEQKKLSRNILWHTSSHGTTGTFSGFKQSGKPFCL